MADTPALFCEITHYFIFFITHNNFLISSFLEKKYGMKKIFLLFCSFFLSIVCVAQVPMIFKGVGKAMSLPRIVKTSSIVTRGIEGYHYGYRAWENTTHIHVNYPMGDRDYSHLIHHALEILDTTKYLEKIQQSSYFSRSQDQMSVCVPSSVTPYFSPARNQRVIVREMLSRRNAVIYNQNLNRSGEKTLEDLVYPVDSNETAFRIAEGSPNNHAYNIGKRTEDDKSIRMLDDIMGDIQKIDFQNNVKGSRWCEFQLLYSVYQLIYGDSNFGEGEPLTDEVL